MLSYNLIIREFIIICACIFFLCFLFFFFNFIFKVRVFINFFNFILQYLINFLISVHDLFQFVWL
jgi:hypothetical protein